MAFWFLGGRRNTAPCHRRHFSQTGCPGVDLSAPSSHKAFIQCPGASEYDLLSAIRRPSVWNKIPSFQKQMQVEPLIRPSPPTSETCSSADVPTVHRPSTHWEAGSHPWFSLFINIHGQPTLRPSCDLHSLTHLLFISMSAVIISCLNVQSHLPSGLLGSTFALSLLYQEIF